MDPALLEKGHSPGAAERLLRRWAPAPGSALSLAALRFVAPPLLLIAPEFRHGAAIAAWECPAPADGVLVVRAAPIVEPLLDGPRLPLRPAGGKAD